MWHAKWNSMCASRGARAGMASLTGPALQNAVEGSQTRSDATFATYSSGTPSHENTRHPQKQNVTRQRGTQTRQWINAETKGFSDEM